MKAAIVIPDGLSAMLFCKGIIATLQKNINGIEISVLSDESGYKNDIEALGAKSVPIPMHRFVNPLKDLAYLARLWYIFEKEKFDIVINFSTKPNIYGTYAAKLARTDNIVIHVVGMGSAFMGTGDVQSRLIRSVFLRLYHLACLLGDTVWFTNKNDMAYFLDHGMVSQKKILLTRNYLPTDEYSIDRVPKDELARLRKEFKLTKRDKVVVMVARMIWAKGIGEFAQAAERLKEKLPRVHFLLIAPLEDKNPDSVPESYIRDTEKKSNLKWLGFRKDVKSLYALSDLAVLPSYYREGGYPRALTEPMAMGKPVIAADSRHCRGTIEHGKNGFLVPAKDSAALADAIETIMLDDKLRKEFGKYSLVKVKRDFDESVILQKAIEQIIRSKTQP